MAINIPSTTPEQLSLGQCIMYVGSVGSTPSTDVGVLDDVSVHLSTDWITVMDGDPSMIIDKYPTGNSAYIDATLLEWNYNRFKEAIGSADSTSTTLEFGGYKTASKYSLMLTHVKPDADTVAVYFWKVMGSGNFEITFRREVHSFPVRFDVLFSSTNWANESLTGSGQLFKLIES